MYTKKENTSNTLLKTENIKIKMKKKKFKQKVK